MPAHTKVHIRQDEKPIGFLGKIYMPLESIGFILSSLGRLTGDCNLLHRIKSTLDRYRGELVLVASFSPILALIILDQESFILGWNEGRGGILFAVLFFLIEWYDSREDLRIRGFSRRRAISWISIIAALSAYYIWVYFFRLQEFISDLGEGWGVSKEGLLSWTWLWEYVVFAAFIIGLIAVLHNRGAVKKVITPIIYCIGSALILLIDALFPYESLGFLAGIVPFIVKVVVSMLWISGVSVIDNPLGRFKPPWVYVEENFLFLRGFKGLVVLEINWPCAGILSMLIYILVVVILMVKMDAPRKRKLIYLIVGAIGTFMVNIIRIFLITIAVVYSNIDLRVFHETVGEVLFVIWIVIYLMATLSIEKILASRPIKLPFSGRAV